MSEITRLGVFGGTFDPIHFAHLDIARAALDQARLDRVLFVVSARPPHKLADSPCATAEQRYAMVSAALADQPRMAASRIELDREGVSYTVDTLRTLAETYRGAALSLIIGYDSLVDLPQWRDPRQILALARLVAVPRPGELAPIPALLEGHYTVLEFDQTSASSTEVRHRFAQNLPVHDLVPPAVEAMIRREGIYPCR